MNKREKEKLSKLFNIIGIIFVMFCGFTVADACRTFLDLKKDASSLQKQLKATVDSIDAEDMSSAEKSLEEVNSLNSEMHLAMNKPIMKVAAVVSGQVRSANALLDIVDDASLNVISPVIDTLSQYPISQLKVGDDGFNVNLINNYLMLSENVMPKVVNISEELNRLNIKFEKNKIYKYKEELNEISKEYNEVKDYLPVIHSIMGDGSDKYYLFPIQNTAEMRACGGFPGSVGYISISNGVLTIGDFDTPYHIFPNDEQGDWKATEDEVRYFGGFVTAVRDAGFIPDFPRVAYIWANGKEANSGQHVDGVISMTPVMVQKMLDKTNTSITLSDGTVLNGENATQYLQYDIYDKYFGEYNGSKANNITDSLFAETAEKAMKAFVSSFSIKNVVKYLPMLSESIKKRELMIWFADEQEEKSARDSDCAGALNNGVDNAVTGVFYSFNGSKAGWFFDINNKILDSSRNDDGSITYHVQTEIVNNMDQDVIDKQNPYIMNVERDGIFRSFVQIVAPYGGSISDAECAGKSMEIGNYSGNQLAYDLNVFVYPKKPLKITYTITTASDVTDELSFATTPTLSEYRQAAG